MSYVTEYPFAASDIALSHFSRRLSVETDCADVAGSLSETQQDFVLLHVAGSLSETQQDFVLLHVVGSTKHFTARHIPGAIHLPHREITPERMAEWPEDTRFVVYCAGPHCNGADQAALKLAQLGRPVKIMIGGITGWEDEGFAFA